MDILVGILRAILFVVIAYAVVFVAALVNILFERRVMAFIGDRLGPNRTGPQGVLQSIADAFKMMGKEDFRPLLADPVLFTLAPVTVMIGAVAIQLVLPVHAAASWRPTSTSASSSWSPSPASRRSPSSWAAGRRATSTRWSAPCAPRRR